MNLVVNARDAMPKGGMLVVETSAAQLHATAAQPLGVAPGAYTMLAVSDTGCGMSEETKRHLFEPFFTTKPQGSGTGLGLSTVYGIVKQSGGAVEVMSEVDEGTTVRIYLPQLEGGDEPAPAAAAPASEPRGTETILVVEDHADVRRVAAEFLRSYGYQVVEAENGEQALAICGREKSIDLVLTDVVMPGLYGGGELARKIGELRPDLPVVFMSGYTGEKEESRRILNSGSPYLQKPFTREALGLKIRQVLDASSAS
jgi:CheY-like chemotaxis protein